MTFAEFTQKKNVLLSRLPPEVRDAVVLLALETNDGKTNDDNFKEWLKALSHIVNKLEDPLSKLTDRVWEEGKDSILSMM